MSQKTAIYINEPIAIVGMETWFNHIDGIEQLFQAVYTGIIPAKYITGESGFQDQKFPFWESTLRKVTERALAQAVTSNGVNRENIGIITSFSDGPDQLSSQKFGNFIAYLRSKGTLIEVSDNAFPFLDMLQQAARWLSEGKLRKVLLLSANIDLDNAERLQSAGTPHFGFDQNIHDWTIGQAAIAIVVENAVEANKNGDHIFSLFKSVTAEGADKPTRPQNHFSGVSPNSIEKAALSSFKQAGISYSDIGYLETFGCGQDSLDKIEIEGLCRSYPGDELNCAIGSIQSLVGYTGATAGLAALVKTVLCLYHRFIPLTPSWSNPKFLDLWKGCRFYVPGESRPWFSPATQPARFAAINVLSPDGSCAHLILSEDKGQREHPNPLIQQIPFHLIPIAADDPATLVEGIAHLKSTLSQNDTLISIANDCFAAYQSQSSSKYTAVVVGHDRVEVERELEMALKGVPIAFNRSGEWQTPNGSYFTALPLGQAGKVAFVYPGAFNSYIGMGEDLFTLFPHLHEKMGEVTADIGDKLREKMLYPRSLTALTEDSLKIIDAKLQSDAIAMLITGTALAYLYTSTLRDVFDVHPASTFGYSLGEFSMGFATGVWTSGDDCTARLQSSEVFKNQLAGPQYAIRTAWGLSKESVPSADPLWVNYVLMTTPEMVKNYIQNEPRVYLTHINTPRQVVIGGDPSACQRVISALHCSALRAPFNYALHCDAILSEFDGLAYLHTWPVSKIPDTVLYSADGYKPAIIEEIALGKGIANALVHCLDFPKLIHQVYQDGARIYIEVGAGSNCTRWVDETLKDQPHVALGINRRGADDHTSILRALARLVSHRTHVNLAHLYTQPNLAKAKVTTLVDDDWQAWQ